MSALAVMGDEERSQYEKIRDARRRLFAPPQPPKGYEYRQTNKDEAWVAAMRRDPVETRRVFVEDILRIVCAHYEVSRVDIVSHRRNVAIVRPRQTAMYLAREFTRGSLPEIGRRFGNRDHTTVLHALRAVEKRKAEDPKVAADIRELKKLLGAA